MKVPKIIKSTGAINQHIPKAMITLMPTTKSFNKFEKNIFTQQPLTKAPLNWLNLPLIRQPHLTVTLKIKGQIDFIISKISIDSSQLNT